jgi:D-inositol-3-phosphate glycosyltransferase
VRILFVSHYALPHLGGVEVAIDAMAVELGRRGHEVTHVASDAVRPGEPEARDASYRRLRLRALNVLEDRTGAPWPVFGPRLLRTLRRELAQADVVHAHGFIYMSSLAALLLARKRGEASPLRVLTEHVGHVPYDSRVLDGAEGAAIGALGRLGARSAEALIYFNDEVGALLRRLAPDALQRRIPNGVDIERYRPPEPGEREAIRAELGWDERPRALFAGRLVAKKGVGLALEIAAAGRGAFELAMAGPGDLDRSPPRGVETLGALPPERLAEVYRAADVFLLPSRGEGFPLAVQEAMASGLPVLLADEPAYHAHLDGAGAGARLLSTDAERMAAAVTELVSDADMRAAAGHDAVAHARRTFSWRTAADRHEELYAELAELRSSQPSRSSSPSTGPRSRVP